MDSLFYFSSVIQWVRDTVYTQCLAQNLNNSWFSFWRRHPNHNYFFLSLSLEKTWWFSDTQKCVDFSRRLKCSPHQVEHCLIFHGRGCVPWWLFAFCITAIMDCVVVLMMAKAKLCPCHVPPSVSASCERCWWGKSQLDVAPAFHSNYSLGQRSLEGCFCVLFLLCSQSLFDADQNKRIFRKKDIHGRDEEQQTMRCDGISNLVHLLARCLPGADADTVSITNEAPSPIQVLLAPP